MNGTDLEGSQPQWNPERAALVVNVRSRTGQRAYQEAHERLKALGLPIAEAYPIQEPSRLRDTVHRVLEADNDLLILGGGDGTVSSVVDELAGHSAVLGLLPLGTANDFARTLQIPTEVGAACETITEGKLVDVDLGFTEGDYYVNLASVGLSVEATRSLTPWLKRYGGALAYPVAAVRAFLRHEPFSAKLTFPAGDHEPIEFGRLLQIGVGNGRFYGGGLAVAPAASMDDQTLDVYAIELGRSRDLVGVGRYLKSGKFIESELVHHYLTSAVRVETEPKLPVNVDGELIARTPEEFSIAHNALKVIVPQHSASARYDR